MHTSECTFHNAVCLQFMLNIAICSSFTTIHNRFYTAVRVIPLA